MGSGQSLSVSTDRTLTLRSNNGTGGGTHVLNVYTLKDGNKQGEEVIIPSKTITDVTDSSENTGSNVEKTGYVSPKANIEAGRWAGNLVFTVKVNTEG